MGFDVLPAVAREAILARFERRDPGSFAARGELAQPAPVFVTLKIAGVLRGCIGCLAPAKRNVIEETMDRALAAAFEDPRFPPLEPHELDRCAIEVTVLGALEEVESHGDLDAARYGIELRDAHGRRAVLLPGIEGVDTVEQQLALTRKKGGIPDHADVEIRRFEVRKVAE